MSLPYLLAFESSCDETSASVILNGHILSNVIVTQTIHEQYGGVVPEIASRAHLQYILPVMTNALEKASVTLDDIQAIGFTQSPGLIGSLLVGSVFAKTLAQSRNLPLIPVDHIEAHAIAAAIDHPNIEFPYLCLVISGGHSQFMICHDYTRFEVIGRTRDDAVGEAFDKIAKLLDLPYPGGPMLQQAALGGNPLAYEFPISEIKDLDFSFSGIKTSVLYFLKQQLIQDPNFIENNKSNIAASVQYTLVKTMITKLKKAVKQTGIKRVALSGGVSANQSLRQAFLDLCQKEGYTPYLPEFQYCTDNAGMIAFAADHKWKNGMTTTYDTVPTAHTTNN